MLPVFILGRGWSFENLAISTSLGHTRIEGRRHDEATDRLPIMKKPTWTKERLQHSAYNEVRGGKKHESLQSRTHVARRSSGNAPMSLTVKNLACRQETKTHVASAAASRSTC